MIEYRYTKTAFGLSRICEGGDGAVTEKRKALLKRAAAIHRLNHPNYEAMSDEQLERYVVMIERAFEEAFKEG